MPPKNSKKRLMISATVVSAALGMAAAPAVDAQVTPIGHAKPPPFNDPSFQPEPVGHLNVPPFSDPKFFEGRWPHPTSCAHPAPSCLKPPPGIEPV